MAGPINAFLEADHQRLDALLRAAVADPDHFDGAAYAQFRAGLLRHIAIEEKLLLPALRRARPDGFPQLRQLRIDHGALASLLVPSPSHQLVAEIRSILEPHNAVEEGPGGLYSSADELLASEAEALLEKARAYPDVKVAPYNDRPGVFRAAADALRSSARQFDSRPPPTDRRDP